MADPKDTKGPDSGPLHRGVAGNTHTSQQDLMQGRGMPTGATGKSGVRGAGTMAENEKPLDDMKESTGVSAAKGKVAVGKGLGGIKGENTAEGDIGNRVKQEGGVDPEEVGRTKR